MIEAIAAAAGGQIIGSLIGADASRRASDKQLGMQQRALDLLMNAEIPTEEKLKVIYESPELVGLLQENPEIAEQLGLSSFEGISVDPRLKQAQFNVLKRMQEGAEKGMSPIEAAELNRITNENEMAEQARQSGIIQEMQRRGVAGSGIELANRLQSSQSTANRAGQQGLDIAAQATRRMYENLARSGEMASSLRSADYNEQADLARMRDDINKQNTMLRADVNRGNIAHRRQIAASNLAAQQTMEDQRVAARNRTAESAANAASTRADFDIRRRSGAAGQMGNIANTYGAQGQQAGQMWADIAKGIGQGAAGYLDYTGKQADSAAQRAHEIELAKIKKGP